jgi:hypothetical protein
MFTCPVCFFEGMTEPPQDYNICECCGTEFGNDDEDRTYEELREQWRASGAKWFFGEPPLGWNPWKQSQVLVISLHQPQYLTSFAKSSIIFGEAPSASAPPRHARHITKGAIEIFSGLGKNVYGSTVWGKRRAYA